MFNRKFGCQDGIFGNTIQARVRILSSSNSEFEHLFARFSWNDIVEILLSERGGGVWTNSSGWSLVNARVSAAEQNTIEKEDIDNRNRKFDNSKSRPPKIINLSFSSGATGIYGRPELERFSH